MSKSEISWRRSIFTRLIALFILVIIPIYIWGVGVFELSNRQLSEEVLKSTKAQVSYYVNSIDNEIQRIKKLQSDFTRDADLNQLAAANEFEIDFDSIRAILRVQQRLTEIKNSSEYISNARVIIPAMNWAINASGSGKGTYTDLTEEGDGLAQILRPDSRAQMLQINDRLLLVIKYPIYYDKEKMPLFVIEIELDKNRIKNELSKQYNSNGVCFSLDFPIYGPVVHNIVDNDFEKQIKANLEAHLNEKPSDAISVKVNKERYLFIYEKTSNLGLTLSIYLPEKQFFKSFDRLKLLYFLFSILVIIFILVYYLFTYNLIRKPLMSLIKSFKKVEQGNFLIKIEYNTQNEIGFLIDHFNQMVENLNTLIDQVYKQKILAQKAELKQLQSQINPHFLYNSYFLLHRIIKKGDYTNAVYFSKGLGVYFKYITQSTGELVDLDVEVEHARAYTELQAMRFEGRIETHFGTLPEGTATIQVPKLILQPIIENAFEHGLENKLQNGCLIVRFEKLENGVCICVEDNGGKCDAKKLEQLKNDLQSSDFEKEMTGLLNINKRIKMLYKNGSGIRVSRSESGGLTVSVIILI